MIRKLMLADYLMVEVWGLNCPFVQRAMLEAV